MSRPVTAAPRHNPKRRPDLETLYCVNDDGSRNVIHTADVKGRFQVIKKITWTLLISIYLALPWIEIGGHPAVLIEIATRHFYLFGHTFNAQDFYLAFFFVSGIGFALIVLSALYGRVWCGYACPQTVFLEGIYRQIERWIDGKSAQREVLGRARWSAKKLGKRLLKWSLFLAVSMFIAHSFLSYFIGVDELLEAVTSDPAQHSTSFAFVVIFSVLTLGNFAWFREQLCIVICPYGRLQGVLIDPDTVVVGYDQGRGEPRGKYNEKGRGDCIDCHRCVAVCPTGIDIRNGNQLECIGCANCIDACDEVMLRVGQEAGLVRYDSQSGFEEGRRKFLRPRLAAYIVLAVAGLAASYIAVGRRTEFDANLSRQHGAAFEVDGKIVRNRLQLHLINKLPETRHYVIEPVPRDGVKFIVPITQIDLASLAPFKGVVMVEIDRDKYRLDMKAALDVRTGELVRRVEMPLVGPNSP